VIHFLHYQVIVPQQRIVKFNIMAVWLTSLFFNVPFMIDKSTVNDRSQNVLSAIDLVCGTKPTSTRTTASDAAICCRKP